MTQEIIIDISPAGGVKVDAQGFNGNGCAQATEQIELVLGGSGQKKKTPKPEYYAQGGQNTSNNLTF